jgi:anti-anti-sigma factor
MGMLIEHETSRGIDIVTAGSKSLLEDHVAEAWESLKQIIRDGSGRMVLDVSLVEYLDGAGLALPIKILQGARRRGGDVYLVMPNTRTPLRALLELTRLDRVFRLYPDVASAVTAFCQDQSPSPPT